MTAPRSTRTGITLTRGQRIAVTLLGFAFTIAALIAGGFVGARFIHTPASAADLTPTQSTTRTADCSVLCRGSGSGGIGVIGTAPMTGGTVGSGNGGILTPSVAP